MVGRTEEDQDLLRADGYCDVGGKDRLRVDVHGEEVDEAIDHLCELDESAGVVVLRYSDERTRLYVVRCAAE